MFAARHPAREGQPVDVGTVVLVEHQARAVVAAQHQFVIAHLSAHGQTHLVGRRGHEEVAVDGCHDLMSRPRVARRHLDGRLGGHRLLAAQAGLHDAIGGSEVHLGDTHLERHGGQVILGCGHARSHQMREH